MRLEFHKRSELIKVQLVGGLGNQMFQYSAARSLCQKIGFKLKLDFSQIGVGGTNHGKTILNFRLHDDVSISGLDTSKIAKSVNRSINIIENRLPIPKNWNFFRNHTYHSLEPGYDDGVLSLTKSSLLKGYFQSHIYPDQIRMNLLSDFTLRSSSNWFREISTEAEITKPLIVHIRRGDYLELKDDFGILSEKYYQNALEFINQNKSEVWVFSDAPELAKILFQRIDMPKFRLIDSTHAANPNESLCLMSKGSKIVIANSTFSWWAAYLSQNDTDIIAPQKWFRNRTDPKNLIPSHWKQIESHWVH